MSKLSLAEKIKKYVLYTNSITVPKNDQDAKLFDSIMDRDSTLNYELLNLSELREALRKFAYIIVEEQIAASLYFYEELAKEMGIVCINIDTDSVTNNVTNYIKK